MRRVTVIKMERTPQLKFEMVEVLQLIGYAVLHLSLPCNASVFTFWDLCTEFSSRRFYRLGVIPRKV